MVMSLTLGILVLVMLVFWMLVIPIWVYRDAKKRGMSALGWAVLMYFFSPFMGLVIYAIVRGPILENEGLGDQMSYGKGRMQKDIRCPHCQEIIDRGHPFCPHCGEKLKDECPYCHQPLEQSWRRCAHCGELVPEYVRRRT